ncbi:hypothetical protein J6590_052841 [Homalodisca vitripennis]|nr:hypothetical protein J6590_052841 [Homalodisca vitripennis]
MPGYHSSPDKGILMPVAPWLQCRCRLDTLVAPVIVQTLAAVVLHSHLERRLELYYTITDRLQIRIPKNPIVNFTNGVGRWAQLALLPLGSERFPAQSRNVTYNYDYQPLRDQECRTW